MPSMSIKSRSNFNRCQLKTFEKRDSDFIFTCPKLPDTVRLVVTTDHGEKAEPRKDTQMKLSYDDIRKNIGNIFCSGCEFIGLSPLEFTNAKTELARAEAELLLAERALQQIQGDASVGVINNI